MIDDTKEGTGCNFSFSCFTARGSKQLLPMESIVILLMIAFDNFNHLDD